MKTQTTISEAMKNGNSTINQTIKGKFIGQHVYSNVNSMVEYIISKGFEDSNAPFTMEDVLNWDTYPEYNGKIASFEGGSEEAKQAEIDRLNELLDDDDFASEEVKQSCIDDIEALEYLESEPQEVFEWWLISSYLCEKLAELGHPVIESEGIWGRCTTGQAILLDYSITQICANMEILEGQANSWA